MCTLISIVKCKRNERVTASLEIVALTTSRIYFMIYSIDITNIDAACT